ncbi:peptidase [Sphaerisporangium siamense]|uniref:Pimeloyl-ACP methyl ester carboxylesterase n=1 Tax=Sphaerisporangium siamense TaxID=795645 RepID=A0A7W7DDT4_9ACTN|nr:alpha/beta hydrolase [Sphaerisporangium siamense]MBB4704982.1 pimeloyl-ACP methyl ester carboxylesterase [Sphaerisporangium siamense]GII83787.1 peptidase [Sphaerisporangium siamense]
MRRTVPILAALLGVLISLLPAVPAAAGPAPLAWAPCPEDATVQCASLTLPVNWDAPRGAAFRMAVALRPAADPSARVGTLVINPGGPGNSGVDAVLTNWLGLSPELLRRFDVVGFDPRGVGRSNPVLCSLRLAMAAPDPLMADQAAFDRRLAYNARYRDDCRARTGPLYDRVDSASVVRDLDALRAALGEPKLTFYGVSYGTLIGQLYAERFPGRVRALALDSNMDHSLGTTAMLDTDTWTTQDSFDQFAAWCARSADCALHGRDVRALWRDLLERAGRGELPDPTAPGAPLAPIMLIYQVFNAFYAPDWPAVADLLHALDTGAPARTAAAPAEEPEDEVFNDATQVVCQDFLLPIRDHREFARHLRRLETIAPDMRMSPVSVALTVACLGQPAPVPNPQHRLRVDGTPPLLLVNGRHDPAAGYPWALSTARQIGDEARLLTYDGAGHGMYGRTPCVTGAVDRYLVSRALPAPGAHCAPAPVAGPAPSPARAGLTARPGALPPGLAAAALAR